MRRTLNLIPLSSPSRNRNISILSNLQIRNKIKLIICHKHQIIGITKKIANFHSKPLDFFHIAKWMSSTIRNVPLQWVRKKWLAIGSKWNSKRTDYRQIYKHTNAEHIWFLLFFSSLLLLFVYLPESQRPCLLVNSRACIWDKIKSIYNSSSVCEQQNHCVVCFIYTRLRCFCIVAYWFL